MVDTKERFEPFFRSRGWLPHAFQEEVWKAHGEGRSGLVHLPTGLGKTYAVYLGPLNRVLADRERGMRRGSGPSVVYVTPLRALARNLKSALELPLSCVEAHGVSVGLRTGDTGPAEKARQVKHMPEVLLTTPESLTLLLSHADSERMFRCTRVVIMDEWHELLSSKRGVQAELALSRLRAINPDLITWGMTATIGNVEQAAEALCGVGREHVVVEGPHVRETNMRVLVPPHVDSFPWSGHLGLNMVQQLCEWLDPDRSTIVFTNTRSQAERWYHAIKRTKPEWESLIGLHHGSLDRDERSRVEAGVQGGWLSFVVATSSLDLGIDFAPVQRVVQIGSTQSVSRLLQRAGRSNHRPGAASEVLCVPTNALELVDMAALRCCMENRSVERRVIPRNALDVLIQHLCNCALGGGFVADDLYAEVTSCFAYSGLTWEEFDWCIHFVVHGGKALANYPQFQRVDQEEDGVFRMGNRRLARMHRMQIGTIASDAAIRVKFLRGGVLGHVEESFIARLRPGDSFFFAGRALEFVRLRDGEAHVRRSSTGRAHLTPRWTGGSMALSDVLSGALCSLLGELRDEPRERESRLTGLVPRDELTAMEGWLCAQRKVSLVPCGDYVLCETWTSNKGSHAYVYPFAGKLVHEGLGALTAWRVSQIDRNTLTVSCNDYGFELFSAKPLNFKSVLTPDLFRPDNLQEHMFRSVNAGEFSRRQFREISRIAGLVFQGYPGSQKAVRQVQASAGLIYDVLAKYEPDNLLLAQAEREVLERHFQLNRMAEVLTRIHKEGLRFVAMERPSPFAFALYVQRVGARLSSEDLVARIERMKKAWNDESGQ